MTFYSKRYSVKIPSFISIMYCDKSRAILIKGPLNQKLLKLKVKLHIDKKQNLINITNISFDNVSNRDKKLFKSLQGTTTSLIKQFIHEVSSKIYKKLNFVGVGYKAFSVKTDSLKLTKFKLGYSHDIFIKVFNNTDVNLYKSNILFISGNDFQDVSKLTSLIRSYKMPEPYKGKGILYENETIKLKERKRI